MATDKSKFDKAVDRARGVDGEGAGGGVSDVNVGGSEALIGKLTPEELAKMAASGDWEFAPQLKSLEEGDMISGILEGYGPGSEFTNKDTGEVTYVNTWIIASPDGLQRASILSSAQLDRKMPPFIGGTVRVIRGKDIKTSGGFRVTDYIVAGQKATLKAGRREWATEKPFAIDGQRVADTKALPAGAEVPADVATAAAPTNNVAPTPAA